MKKAILLLLITSFVWMSSCGDDDDDGGAQAVTYSGKDGSTTYTLKITEAGARYAAQEGDSYELTVGKNKSRGTVTSVSGDTLTLTPSNSSVPFTATVSDDGLTGLDGTVTWTNRQTENFSSKTLTPNGASSSGGGGGGGGGSGLNGNWVDTKGGVLVLSGGSFTQKNPDKTDIAKGTYKTSGDKMTMTLAQIHGAMLGEELGFKNQWYNKTQFRAAYLSAMNSIAGGVFDATKMVDDVVDQMFAPQEATYTLSGNTLTLNWEVDMEVSGPAGIGNMSWHSSGTDVYTRNGTGGNTGGGNTGGGNTGGGSGNNYPPSNILTEYGLSGLTPITGATNVAYTVTKMSGVDALSIIFDGSSATDTYVSNWFTTNGWTEYTSSTGSDSIMYMYSKPGFSAIYNRDLSDNDCSIVSYKGGLGF